LHRAPALQLFRHAIYLRGSAEQIIQGESPRLYEALHTSSNSLDQRAGSHVEGAIGDADSAECFVKAGVTHRDAWRALAPGEEVRPKDAI
jgi:hypothetical protein